MPMDKWWQSGRHISETTRATQYTPDPTTTFVNSFEAGVADQMAAERAESDRLEAEGAQAQVDQVIKVDLEGDEIGQPQNERKPRTTKRKSGLLQLSLPPEIVPAIKEMKAMGLADRVIGAIMNLWRYREDRQD